MCRICGQCLKKQIQYLQIRDLFSITLQFQAVFGKDLCVATVGEGENVREIAEKAWRILRFPLIAVFGVLPLSFVIAVWFANELPNWVWLWPAGYVVLDVLGMGICGKWRILYGFVVTALILYVGAHGIL